MIKNSFFNRQSYLDILEKRVIALKDGYRQNIAIIADEFIGKTSLIFKFLNKFYDNRLIFVYLEIRLEALDSFAKRFIGTMLYNFLANSGIPLKEDLDFLIFRSAKYIPKTTEKIKLILNALEKRKKNNIFGDLLSLSESIHQETNKCCVVIFDEFHQLQNLGVKNLYHEWSKILILQKNTMYIITSSMKFKAKNIISKNLSLLFGNFEVLTLEPFEIKTSEEYLESRLEGLGIEKGIKDFIVHFTGGYPFYLELISEAISHDYPRDFVEIIEDLFFNPAGILNQKFYNYLKHFLVSAHSKDYVLILYLISSGSNKLKDIAHILRKPKKELNLRINNLLESDTLIRSGDFLKINDRLFAFWLKFVYQEKTQSLTFDQRNPKALFRDKIAGMIREFILSSQQSVMERTAEVLRLFEDEIMQMENKKLRLNRFREIKPLELKAPGLRQGLIGRSTDNLWIMAFKENPLTEEDVAGFASECKRYRHKSQRKIIITTQEIDANARLRALEEKIWTWDLKKLNQILDLFYKPRVIK